jgi:zinc transport system permease protein
MDFSFAQLLQYGFMQKAFVAGSFTALTCSALGLFLVLRNMSLIGDGLSHVSFGAIALGLFMGVSPSYVALPVVIVGSYLILKIAQKTGVYSDTAIGIVSSVAIASGVILASLSHGFNVDLLSYLFGSILAVSWSEVWLSAILSVVVLLLLFLSYWDLFSVTFDEEYAKVSGIKTETINTLLTVLTAVVVVLAVKVVGVMLVSALLILPAVSALQIASGFSKAFWYAGIFAVVSVLVGVTVSFFADLPAGATVVMINASIFAGMIGIRRFVSPCFR